MTGVTTTKNSAITAAPNSGYAEGDGDPAEDQHEPGHEDGEPRGGNAPNTRRPSRKTGETDLASLASELKSALGTGGTDNAGHFELRGDHTERVRGLLDERGYAVTG